MVTKSALQNHCRTPIDWEESEADDEGTQWVSVVPPPVEPTRSHYGTASGKCEVYFVSYAACDAVERLAGILE